MSQDIRIARPEDSAAIAKMATALMEEIMSRIREHPFIIDLESTAKLCERLIREDRYEIFLAEASGRTIGFLSLCPSVSLYAGGDFGIIQELFVTPSFRGCGTGRALLESAIHRSRERSLKRLEVATPPPEAFPRTISFYEVNGFSRTGGYKLRRGL